jgi:hypothetical protein
LGVTGFSSLLSRALVLGCTETPWLCALTVDADGALSGLEELEAGLDAPAVAEGELVLIGHLLRLLVTFIGPALTLRLLHEVWPDWAIDVFETENLL